MLFLFITEKKKKAIIAYFLLTYIPLKLQTHYVVHFLLEKVLSLLLPLPFFYYYYHSFFLSEKDRIFKSPKKKKVKLTSVENIKVSFFQFPVGFFCLYSFISFKVFIYILYSDFLFCACVLYVCVWFFFFNLVKLFLFFSCCNIGCWTFQQHWVRSPFLIFYIQQQGLQFFV